MHLCRLILALTLLLPTVLPAADKPYDLEEWTPAEVAAEIIRRLDKNESIAELVQPAAEHGVVMARACAEGLKADQPQRNEALCNLIAMSARCRQNHREILKLYEPLAYETFYGPNAAKEQFRYESILTLSPWPRRAPEALVNAAPIPLLAWMRTQSTSAAPDLEKLLPIWSQWGATILWLHERQYAAEVRALTPAFFKNKKFAEDWKTLAALVRFAGETRALEAREFILRALQHANPAVRSAACRAVQRLGGMEPPLEFLELVKKEEDVHVLIDWAEAAQEWNAHDALGVVALDVFKQNENPELRRALIFSAARALWKTRAELMGLALASKDASVHSVALQALGEKTEVELGSKILELMLEYPEPPAPLIDALGRLQDRSAAMYLIEGLRKSKNQAVRVKMVLALEKISGDLAAKELIEQLKNSVNIFFAQQVAGSLGRMKATGADSVLSIIAEDPTAPLPVRMQCIWGLGGYNTKIAKVSLQKLDNDPAHYFGFGAAGTDTPASRFEQLEQARLLIKLALFQQGEKEAEQAAVEMYHAGTPTTQVAMLMMFAQLKLDHPVIAEGLRSPEFAIVLASVHAAGASAPSKYYLTLVELRDSPFLRAIVDGGMNPMMFEDALKKAIAAGQTAQKGSP